MPYLYGYYELRIVRAREVVTRLTLNLGYRATNLTKTQRFATLLASYYRPIASQGTAMYGLKKVQVFTGNLLPCRYQDITTKIL